VVLSFAQGDDSINSALTFSLAACHPAQVAARFDESQKIVPGTSGNGTTRYMTTPSRGQMRGDQSIDSKTLQASEVILPSDSLPRRVPGYGLWKTRDGVNVDRGGERIHLTHDH
jgi:hypothetical protein